MSEFEIKITENTKFICNFADEDGKLSVDWNYSESAKELGMQFVMEQMYGYFGVDLDDLSKDLLDEGNIEGYIDTVCFYYNYSGQIAESLMAMKNSLLKVTTDISFEELEEIINEVNSHLILNGYTNKFICFENFQKANNFLKENFKTSFEEDSIIFDRVYMINK